MTHETKAQPVNGLAVMDAAIAARPQIAITRALQGHASSARDLIEARAAVAELIGKADAVATTLEMPTLAKQSTKNPNAGFIDWRDWCALKGEVAALRAALARVGGVA